MHAWRIFLLRVHGFAAARERAIDVHTLQLFQVLLQLLLLVPLLPLLTHRPEHFQRQRDPLRAAVCQLFADTAVTVPGKSQPPPSDRYNATAASACSRLA